MNRTARRKIYNAIFVGFCLAATMLSLATLAIILWSLVQKGIGGLDSKVFLLDTPAPGSVGGLKNAIVGSVVLLSGGILAALVVGILAGTWLAEFGGQTPYGHLIRFLNDVLLTAPSILVGLFVYEILVKNTIHHFSTIAGAVALAILAVPIVTRTTEDILALQSQALREAGSALGTPQWIVVRKIIWRSAGGGLLTGGLLAFARISGETAPLLFTAFGNQFSSDWKHPISALTHPISSLPQVIFQFALSPYDDWQRLAWVGALLIAAAVLIVNVLGRVIAREPHRS